MNCPITKCPHYASDRGGCAATRCLNYIIYRHKTGLCETCGQTLKRHQLCEGCGVLIGTGHLDISLMKFRGHKLCATCRLAWLKLEQIVGEEVLWEDREQVRERERKRRLNITQDAVTPDESLVWETQGL